jgi:hypothetical protein
MPCTPRQHVERETEGHLQLLKTFRMSNFCGPNRHTLRGLKSKFKIHRNGLSAEAFVRRTAQGQKTMQTKLVIGICCALVLGLAPLAGAHLTSSSATSAALTGDAYRWTDNTPSTNNGVSGTYIGASGVVVAGDIFPLSINPVLTLCPLGYCAAGNALCDLEVLSSGADTDPLKVLDEKKVDGGNGVGGDNGGIIIDDGTVDDGGLGAACHTNGYAEDDYNTLGCSGISHAEDAGSEYHVWISASCDDSSQVSVGTAVCVVNSLLAGGNGLVACTDGVTCIVNQTCGAGTFEACGADGQADEANLGEGGGDVDEATHDSFPFSNDPDSPGLPDEPGQGVAYPTDLLACDPLATAATFVFEAVELNAGIGDDPAGPEYALAVGGWIDWTASGTPSDNVVPEGGATVDLCLDPVSSSGCNTFGVAFGPTHICITDPAATTPFSGSCGSAKDTWVTVFNSSLGCYTTQTSHPFSGC